MPKGTYLSRIRTLDDLRARCRVDEDTHCWIFGGQPKSLEPMVWFEDRTMTVGRVAWLLSGKRVPAGNWLAWSTCGNKRCCNPAHRKVGTKAQMGEWLKAQGHLRGRLERRIINRRARVDSKQNKLTPELADWIKESPQTGIELAHALDVSNTAISRVRKGHCWAPIAPAASVFSWRP